MKLSRKDFIQFLEQRLTPESAKSYLAYASAFSRVLGKGNDYLFSVEVTKDEIIEMLKEKLNQVPSFQSHSKSYQSKIRTGVRAIIKYYLHSTVVEKKEISRDSIEKLTPEDLKEHHIYKYKMWLKNKYIKSNGEPFIAWENYGNYIDYSLTDSKLDIREFFNFTKSFQIDTLFIINLKQSKAFRNRTASTQKNFLASINTYKIYLAEINGEKLKSLFRA